MDKQEMKALIGTSFPIHGVRHTCVAADGNVLILLQYDKDDVPVQYVAAHYPSWYEGELVWNQGDYFPLFYYIGSDTPMADALRDAALAANGGTVYVAMADSDQGARCAGVFTREQGAIDVLEKLIVRDGAAAGYNGQLGMHKLTLAEYQKLHKEKSLDNAYWVSEMRVNRPTR